MEQCTHPGRQREMRIEKLAHDGRPVPALAQAVMTACSNPLVIGRYTRASSASGRARKFSRGLCIPSRRTLVGHTLVTCPPAPRAHSGPGKILEACEHSAALQLRDDPTPDVRDSQATFPSAKTASREGMPWPREVVDALRQRTPCDRDRPEPLGDAGLEESQRCQNAVASMTV